MKVVLCIVLGMVGLAILVSVIWRYTSRLTTLPCPTLLQSWIERDNPFFKIHHAKFIIEHLDLKPGMKVLDAGCGPGRLTIPLAQKLGSQVEVVAADIQQGMLNRVKEKAEIANIYNIQFLNVGIGEGKLGFNQFDRVVLVTVLGEIPNREAALKEIWDVLKPGGILSVTEIILDPHFQRRATVVSLAKGAGFHEKKFFGNRFAYTMHFEKPLSKKEK